MKQRFAGLTDFEHGRAPRMGVVLVNLGTPEAPEPDALRRYLAEFLSDPRVVEIPRPVWKIILHGVILRVRPKKSAQAYAKIWTDQGSPLMFHSRALTDQVAQQLADKIPGHVSVSLAMRYGQPAIHQVLEHLQHQGVERLLILPLYPQYSGATTASVADEVFNTLKKWRWMPELRVLGAYHDDAEFIKVLADSVRSHWQQNSRSDKLLISFHGMPKATLLAGDPYYCQCHKTARLMAAELGLDETQWEMAFQSRFGPAEWLQPYVAKRLATLPKEGIKKLDVICPGFAADCVETLEEIAVEGRDVFTDAGGESFSYIPSLNAESAHVQMQVNRILRNAVGWPELDESTAQNIENGLTTTRDLAMAEKASK